MQMIPYIPYKSAFQERLHRAMATRKKDKGGSQSELAQYVGVTRSATSHWFKGKTSALSFQTLERTAEYLMVSTYWLATGKGSMVTRDRMFEINIDGLSDLQSAALNAFAKALDSQRVPDKHCQYVLNECQKLLAAKE